METIEQGCVSLWNDLSKNILGAAFTQSADWPIIKEVVPQFNWTSQLYHSDQ